GTGVLVRPRESRAHRGAPVPPWLATARLRRRLDPPERYEIFHDAFAVALLEWRKGYLQAKAQEEALHEAEERRRVELAELSRRRPPQAPVRGLIALVIGGAALFLPQQRHQAEAAPHPHIPPPPAPHTTAPAPPAPED